MRSGSPTSPSTTLARSAPPSIGMRSRRGRSAMATSPARGWERKFERWPAPFLASLKREAQRHWAPIYLKGLLLPGERQSVEPLAARVAPGDTQQLHPFIGGPPPRGAP